MLLLIFLSILLSIPAVQTQLGKVVTNLINKDFQTNIVVNKVDLSFLGSIKLKDIEIKDHHLDSMINVKSLETSIFSYGKILDNKFEFGKIELEGVNFIIKTYKGESNDAFNIFVDSFDGEKKDTVPSNFLLTSTLVYLNDAYFKIYDENIDDAPVTFKQINGSIYNLLVDGPNFSGDISKLHFIEDHQIEVNNLTTNFSYTRQEMKLLNTVLETKTSRVETDITFFRNGSFKDFNNKVPFEANINKANISLDDLDKFYEEFGEDDVLHFSTNISGTLNNFNAKNLKLRSDMNLVVDGDFNVVNAFGLEKGFLVNAQINNLESDYRQLKNILPDILGKSLPSSFKELGRFRVSGNSLITTNLIDAQIQLSTDLGVAITDLELTNIANIDEANYKGNIKIIDFELGRVINDSLVGKFSIDAEVDGKGFTLETMSVAIDGRIHKHQYKGYTYQNIRLSGLLEDKKFDGKLIANDANLKFDFVGLADLSSDQYKFDFKSIVDYVDFNKLNLFKHDSIAILKGDIEINLVGNTIEDLVGEINFSQASYTNQNDLYFFKDFNITSSYNNDVRTLTFNSPDIINGKIEGQFKFGDLGKIAQNAIGSIYTNYEPYEVRRGQYLEFNFNIYDKVIEILFPEVKLGANTFIRGEMGGDDEHFKLSLRSPSIDVYGTKIDSIRLQIDNQNPLYNTQLSVENIVMDSYKITDFHLVNVTLNDTLYFRTQFKGGFKKTETFNLGFYHTIDENNSSVVGINKSDITYKNQTWYLNPDENKKNKIIFDNELNSFDLQEFEMVSGIQKISLFGKTSGDLNKDINVKFENVSLAGITPEIKDWNLAGLINGELQYQENNGIILPVANFMIEDFFVNESYQGDLKIDMLGENSVQKFDVDVSIKNNGKTNLLATGKIDLSLLDPTIDMTIDFDKLKLDILSPIGDENFTNMRGFVHGNATLKGLLANPAMRGELFLDEAGVALPYLNVDYNFEGTTVVALHEQTFEIVDLALRDIAENTTGTLSGTISHSYFADWKLDLKLATKNLLVLNTKESEELYYGTAFIDGSANITGFTDNLTINVNGRTNKGTNFVIPLSDIKTVENTKLVTFISPQKDEDVIEPPDEILIDKFKGLSINFNLDVTKDAVIEMILDKNTGSSLKGSGTGVLLIELDTNGKFNMFGEFLIDNGQYEYNLAGLAKKRFIATKGGTISWNGNPYTAEINIETVYRVYANPRVVLETVNTNRDIPIDLVTRFTGELYNSKIEFDVLIPDADTDVKSELDFKINQNDNKIMHFGNLLLFGSFYNENSTLFTNGKGLGEDTVYQLLSSAITGLLSTGNDNIKFGFDYRAATDVSAIEDINTKDQVDITVRTKINERILIDGKVGVPVGANKQSTVIGEAKVEFLLNEEGTLRSTVFNRQNEIQYTDEEEGYTQGVGLSYQFDFENGRELLEKLGLKKKKLKLDTIKVDTLKIKTKKDSLMVKHSELHPIKD